jgi:hypothetical protein
MGGWAQETVSLDNRQAARDSRELSGSRASSAHSRSSVLHLPILHFLARCLQGMLCCVVVLCVCRRFPRDKSCVILSKGSQLFPPWNHSTSMKCTVYLWQSVLVQRNKRLMHGGFLRNPNKEHCFCFLGCCRHD